MAETFMLGSYEIGKTLGVGNFSKVKVAIHVPTGRKVAVKLINREKLRTMNMDKKAYREINILRLLNHPNIIRLYEVIESATDLFVVMEYIEGGELYDFIVSHKQLPEKRARRFFQQIIAGISYCHSHMVVHRDLKPENLLLDSEMNVKIADFGLSNMMRDGHFLRTSCGSPNYAAPEVISGQLYAGPEVDVWSCGVILYALLCGFLPFDEGNIKELFRKIKTGDYPLPEHASPGAQHLVSRMLETDPMHRISVDEIIADGWFREELPPGIMLKPSSAFEAPLAELDAEVARRVEEMGYDGELLRRALRLGPDLLTKPPACAADAAGQQESEALRQLAVTYHLLADQLRPAAGQLPESLGPSRAERGEDQPRARGLETKGPVPKNNSERAFREDAFCEVDEAALEKEKQGIFVSGETIDVVSDTSSEELPADAFGAPAPRPLAAKSWAEEGAPQDRRELGASAEESWPGPSWALGLRCTAKPALIMREILAALLKLKMEWKLISPYRVKARFQAPEEELEGGARKGIRLGLQLYKNPDRLSRLTLSRGAASLVQSSSSSRLKLYTLDAQLLSGDLFQFVELFERINSQLRSNESGLHVFKR